jgi:drug/metabolite transporter (DMT)-like permease
MDSTRNSFLSILLVLAGAASYGLLAPLFKLAVQDGLGVAGLTCVQVLSGAVLLWAAVGLGRRRRKAGALAETWQAWLKLAIIGIAGLSLTTVFYNEALSRLDASLGIVLLFQFTWITILLESIRRRQWPSKPELVALLCIAVGTVLAVGLLEQDLSRADGVGVLLGLLSAITYSLFFFLTGFLPVQLDPMAKSAVMSTASFLFVLLLHFPALAGEGLSIGLFGWGTLLGIVGTAFPFFCFNYGIPRLGGGMAALLGSMELPAAIIAAYFLLGEPLTLWQGAGVALILAGIRAAQGKSQQLVTDGKEGESQL